MFVSHYVQSTRISGNSKTLSGNIFSNVITPNTITGNLFAKLSYHLPQFLIAPDIFSDSESTKLNIFERD